MILFIDTETDGLPDKNLPADHPNQPHLVQLGLLLCTPSGSEVSSADLIIRPEGYLIPDGAARVHGITTGIALDVGVPVLTALSVFTQLRAVAKELVAFNFPFDDLIMRAAIARAGVKPKHPGPSRQTCAMQMASDIMKLPPTERMKAAGFDKHKPPNLTEAYQFFFNRKFEGAHSALADCRAAKEIYFEIIRRAISAQASIA